jgi:MFS family permease
MRRVEGAGGNGRLESLRAAWRTWWRVVLLGVLTVGSYGIAVYSFGVIISPVHEQTGWSVGSLSAAFTLLSVIGGVASLGSGWMLDRFGARPIMIGSLVAGSGCLLAAASAETAWQFVLAWGAGGGIISAGLFYNVTMAVTTRLYPEQRVRAFAILTFVGGFAAVIYFPLAGLLVDLLEWRMALRVLVVLMALHVLPAAILISGGGASRSATGPHHGHAASVQHGSVLRAFRTREVLQMVAMFSLAAMAFGAIQVHHVPAMEAAGISLGAATTIASVRGLLSLPGRAFMEPVVRRLGVTGAIGAVYLLMAAGTLPLVMSGNLAWPLVFMLVTGLVFGTISPLHGLYAAEVFGERRIGTLMGMQSLVVSLVSATGPVLLGLTVDVTGGYEVEIVLTAALFAAAFGLLTLRPRAATNANAHVTAVLPVEAVAGAEAASDG